MFYFFDKKITGDNNDRQKNPIHTPHPQKKIKKPRTKILWLIHCTHPAFCQTRNNTQKSGKSAITPQILNTLNYLTKFDHAIQIHP